MSPGRSTANCSRKPVRVFASPRRTSDGERALPLRDVLQLMPDMRDMQHQIGEAQCHLCPAASVSDLAEAIDRYHPETLVISCHMMGSDAMLIIGLILLKWHCGGISSFRMHMRILHRPEMPAAPSR